MAWGERILQGKEKYTHTTKTCLVGKYSCFYCHLFISGVRTLFIFTQSLKNTHIDTHIFLKFIFNEPYGEPRNFSHSVHSLIDKNKNKTKKQKQNKKQKNKTTHRRFKIIKVISCGQKILPKQSKPILKKLEFAIKVR